MHRLNATKELEANVKHIKKIIQISLVLKEFWFVSDWQQFVKDKLKAWKQINLDWLYNFSGPTHVLFYEQLVGDVENSIRSILEFLELPIDENLLKCALERQEGIYRRKRRVLNFDPYSSAMKKQLQMEQEKVYDAIYKVALPGTIKKKRKR